jgi:hypothetical protein
VELGKVVVDWSRLDNTYKRRERVVEDVEWFVFG